MAGASRGLGISLIPELASASVPSGVCAVTVEDPNLAGRRTVGITRQDPSTEAKTVVQALGAEGAELHSHS